MAQTHYSNGLTFWLCRFSWTAQGFLFREQDPGILWYHRKTLALLQAVPLMEPNQEWTTLLEAGAMWLAWAQRPHCGCHVVWGPTDAAPRRTAHSHFPLSLSHWHIFLSFLTLSLYFSLLHCPSLFFCIGSTWVYLLPPPHHQRVTSHTQLLSPVHNAVHPPVSLYLPIPLLLFFSLLPLFNIKSQLRPAVCLPPTDSHLLPFSLPLPWRAGISYYITRHRRSQM